MHSIVRVVLYCAVIITLLLTEKAIPPDETAFRTAVALTFLLWVIVGMAYGLRGVWRFMRS